MPAASAGTAGLGGGPGVGCCSCRVGRPPCRVSHTCSRPAWGTGGVGWRGGWATSLHCQTNKLQMAAAAATTAARSSSATGAARAHRPPCRLPVTAVCGPFQRAAENVTAPPLLYSVLLLLLSSAARGCSARLPSTAAVSSSRRSAADTKGRHATDQRRNIHLRSTLQTGTCTLGIQPPCAHPHTHLCWRSGRPPLQHSHPTRAAAGPRQSPPPSAGCPPDATRLGGHLHAQASHAAVAGGRQQQHRSAAHVGHLWVQRRQRQCVLVQAG